MLSTFNQTLARMREEAVENIPRLYKDIIDFVTELDPNKLLTQLTLTHLFLPEDQYLERENEMRKWERWIEFLTGLLICKPYPSKPRLEINGEHISKIENLLKTYFDNFSCMFMATHVSDNHKSSSIPELLTMSKMYSFYVRGETYPEIFFIHAMELYGDHNEWFEKNLGFTIKDAIHLSKSIENHYEESVNNAITNAKSKTAETCKKMFQNKEDPNDCDDMEASIFCHNFFGRSDAILMFTTEQLSEFSSMKRDTCQHYLDRLSQSYGYKNPKFLKTYDDPFEAPWDYNTSYEKPIIKFDGKYFAPLPHLFAHVLYHTFHYDMMDDSNYKTTYEDHKGKWVEKRTAKCIERIFPSDNIHLNPCYPNGEELCDVLLLHDRKVFIIQCKSKTLTLESKTGKDEQKLLDDLKKGVKDSYDQAVNVRDYLLKSDFAKIIVKNQQITIDMRQANQVFLLSVTTGDYQELLTRFSNINKDLSLFNEDDYPWAISLFDLEIVTDIIESPSMFIHYIQRRLLLEQTSFSHVRADEIDLLSVYLNQGLYFDTNDFKEINDICLSGFSSDIDQYYVEKYHLNKNPAKPKQKMPEGFEEYLSDIEHLNTPYKTDCAITLLEGDYKARETFVKGAEVVKLKSLYDSKLHSFSTTTSDGSHGISFLAMDAQNDVNRLAMQVNAFSILKKYDMKCKHWVGFGVDIKSKKKVDIAIFLSYDWIKDDALDNMAKTQLNKGIKFNHDL